MMQFLCIKWGNSYSPEYVNNLYNMVKRNYIYEFEFHCFTDESEGIISDVNVHPIPDVEPLHPKYWFNKEHYCWDRPKFLLFNSHNWLNTQGPFCYFDLDVIIQSDISDFYELAFEPHILSSYWQPLGQLKDRFFRNIRGTYFNSSCMMWWDWQCEHIYNDVLEHKDVVFKTFYKGSDNYHQWRLPTHIRPYEQKDMFWKFLPKEDYYSFNYAERNDESKLVLFNQNRVPGDKSIGLDELDDFDLLINWHGFENFEKLRMLPFEKLNDLDKWELEWAEKLFTSGDLISLHKHFVKLFPTEDISKKDQSFFWSKTFDDVITDYEEYRVKYLKTLFYRRDFEKIFERFYNPLPKEETLKLMQGDTKERTLLQFFEEYSEKYSDLYDPLYKQQPKNAVIDLSYKYNDTDNEFNDIFINESEVTLSDIKRIFENYDLEWVTFFPEITEPSKAKDFVEICKYFKDKGTNVALYTFTDKRDFEYVDVVYLADKNIISEHQTAMDKILSENKPVDLNTLKQFEKIPDKLYPIDVSKTKDPIWCEARKERYIFISPSLNVFPCSFIARDVLENKLFPYHPIDYPYNWQYGNLNSFKLQEIMYNNDFNNISEHLKENPLSICKVKCGKCNES